MQTVSPPRPVDCSSRTWREASAMMPYPSMASGAVTRGVTSWPIVGLTKDAIDPRLPPSPVTATTRGRITATAGGSHVREPNCEATIR